jgi:tRNA (guanine37-N1)-methyltransferase
MIKINILTLFPQLIEPHFEYLPYKKAVEIGALETKIWNLRDYALDSYGTVDGKVYGGGTGMILMVEPIYQALKDITKQEPTHIKDSEFGAKNRVILLSPKGQRFTQEKAKELSKMNSLTLICGRYEGVDARVTENLVTDVISIGDYITSGGESPSLVITESITRLLPGVLEKEEATKIESFSDGATLEYPQYTRPEDYKGMKVPDVLLSGNHQKIEKWRKKQT